MKRSRVSLIPLIMAGALASSAVVSTAKADVMRIAIVAAASQADDAVNVAMMSTFSDMYKSGGASTVYVGHDAEHMSIASFSVWPDRAALTKVTGAAGWKAAVEKLKYKTLKIEVFDIAP
jgi:hypothetical protein